MKFGISCCVLCIQDGTDKQVGTRPGAARRYVHHRLQFDGGKKSRRIYVRPRTGSQSAHLWWPAVAKLQAASVPIA